MSGMSPIELSVIGAIVWVVGFAGLGGYVAHECGRSELEGAVLSVLFGPLGAIIVALLPRQPR